MSKVKIHINPEGPDPQEIYKRRDFKKIKRKVMPFYLIQYAHQLFRRNKILFAALFVLWVLAMVWLLE